MASASVVQRLASKARQRDLRDGGRRSGETGSAAGQSLGCERDTTADLAAMAGGRENRLVACGHGQRAGDVLTECAVVFLMDARTVGRPVTFDVRTNRGGDGISGRRGVDDPDDARQHGLQQCGGDDPATHKVRNASTHSVVSCGRDAREM
jgi:hypothetical protein